MTHNHRGWIWFTFSEPLNRSDVVGLIGFCVGTMGWIIGTTPPSTKAHGRAARERS